MKQRVGGGVGLEAGGSCTQLATSRGGGSRSLAANPLSSGHRAALLAVTQLAPDHIDAQGSALPATRPGRCARQASARAAAAQAPASPRLRPLRGCMTPATRREGAGLSGTCDGCAPHKSLGGRRSGRYAGTQRSGHLSKMT